MKHLQNQESFSFSTSSSKIGLFSDDEDGDLDRHSHIGDRITDYKQNGYFEISLPPQPPSPLTTKTNKNDAKEEEFEFCFSFNSSSALTEFPTTPGPTSNHPFHHHGSPITTSTVVTSHVMDAVHKKYNLHNKVNSSMTYKQIFQKASSPRCHRGLASPYVFQTPIEGQQATRLRTFNKNQRELVRNGNSSKFGGIRKFMVKLRSIKSMLRSSLSASRRLKPSPIDKVNKKTKKTSIDHKLNKLELQRNCSHMTTKSDDNYNIVANINSPNENQEEEKSSRKMNFYSFSKMLDVVMKNIRVTRRSKQMAGSKSCPVSIKSSPMHDHDERRNSFYLRDHSIQAAIAHCKKSFGI